MEFWELNKRRHATKHFNTHEIDLKDICLAIRMAVLAPSAHNLQPWKFVVVKDKKEALSRLAYGANKYQVNEAQFVIALFTDTDLSSCSRRVARIGKDSLTDRELNKYMKLMPREFSRYAEVQVGEYLALNAGLVAMNLVLSLTNQQISSNIILGFDKSRMNEILEIDKNFRPELLITTGYTDDKLGATYRMPISEFIEIR